MTPFSKELAKPAVEETGFFPLLPSTFYEELRGLTRLC